MDTEQVGKALCSPTRIVQKKKKPEWQAGSEELRFGIFSGASWNMTTFLCYVVLQTFLSFLRKVLELRKTSNNISPPVLHRTNIAKDIYLA